MIVRALVLTVALTAGPVAAQTHNQSPATTASSAGAGDPHTPSAQIQDPTLGAGQRAGSAPKAHRSKPKHGSTAHGSPGMS